MNDTTQARTPKFKIFTVTNEHGQQLGHYYASSRPSAMAMHTSSLNVEEATSAEIIAIGREGTKVAGMFEDANQGRLQKELPGTDAEGEGDDE